MWKKMSCLVWKLSCRISFVRSKLQKRGSLQKGGLSHKKPAQLLTCSHRVYTMRSYGGTLRRLFMDFKMVTDVYPNHAGSEADLLKA